MEDDFAQKDKKETKGRLECGRKVNIENHENRFADMERGRTADGKGLSDNANNSRQWFWRQLGQPGTTLSRCRADNPARRKVANVTREGRKVSESKKDTENFLFGVPILSSSNRYRAGLWRPL